ncbi:MAG: YdcF family protein [Candidatus Margulisbacteria bacterium]|nr:YdcF family protein [Candidatus Margulisiibacteriota bacterium]
MSGFDVIAIVLGYGYDLQKLKAYLEEVIEFCHKNSVAEVVVTGGRTNLPNFLISEAEFMANYFKLHRITSTVTEERCAMTTYENIENVYQMLKGTLSGDERIVVFCDKCRSGKVKFIFRKIFKFWPEIRTCEITQSRLMKIAQRLIFTPFDIFSILYPPLQGLKIEVKRWV